MGFDIPEPYAWDESFRVDYDSLDKQHKCIFTAIFDCSKAPEDAAKLTSLVDVLKTHFTEEEGMMTKASYAEFDDHKKMHDDFVAKIGELSVPLKDDNVNFAKEWLVTHIKGTDHKYKGKL